jgi:DNA adenine methylase
MQYFGGKQRIAKPLSEFLNDQIKPGGIFVDLFCGSCNVVSNIRQDVIRIANDKNEYLIAMWQELQNGFKLPTEVSEEVYQRVKAMPSDTRVQKATKAFVGFGCSFGGKWWKGYARGGEGRNYAENAHNSTMKKASKLKDVTFHNKSFEDFVLPEGAIVYCDIPYKGTTQYSAVGGFPHELFYAWAKKQTHCTLLVSEYKHNVPEGGAIVWEYKSKKDIRNKGGAQEETIEVLWKFA